MTLVGFKARNHPQQTADDNVDDRAITPADFGPINDRFQFTIDAAATAQNTRLPRFWTREQDALQQSWAGERVWCNPPYSARTLTAFVEKAWTETLLPPARRPELVVMLLPANRPEQPWWHEHIEPYRDNSEGILHTEFLRGRMRFLRNGATDIKPNERPPFGCLLAIWSHEPIPWVRDVDHRSWRVSQRPLVDNDSSSSA